MREWLDRDIKGYSQKGNWTQQPVSEIDRQEIVPEEGRTMRILRPLAPELRKAQVIAGKMAQQVKVPAAKPDNLSLVP